MKENSKEGVWHQGLNSSQKGQDCQKGKSETYVPVTNPEVPVDCSKKRLCVIGGTAPLEMRMGEYHTLKKSFATLTLHSWFPR